MNAERIRLIHSGDQIWQSIRGFRKDIERIAQDGPSPDDKRLIQALCKYFLAEMAIADHDTEDI